MHTAFGPTLPKSATTPALLAHVAICIPSAIVAISQSFFILRSFICLLIGVSMTAAAAAALTQTSQVSSGPEAKVPMMATPSGSLQPNWQLHFQAPLKDASTVDASASKAATAAAAMPLSTPLPSMPMQTTGKLLLPATAVLLPVKIYAGNLASSSKSARRDSHSSSSSSIARRGSSSRSTAFAISKAAFPVHISNSFS